MCVYVTLCECVYTFSPPGCSTVTMMCEGRLTSTQSTTTISAHVYKGPQTHFHASIYFLFVLRNTFMLCELKKLCSVHLYSDIDTLDRHNNSLTIRLHMNLVSKGK